MPSDMYNHICCVSWIQSTCRSWYQPFSLHSNKRCTLRTVFSTLPPLIVLAIISTKLSLGGVMNTELLSPDLEYDLQDSEENEAIKNIEQEIECPRCYDIMLLSSDFDKLQYFCQECGLSLVMK